MKNINIILYLLLIVSFASCKKGQKTQPGSETSDNNKWAFEQLNVKKEIFADKDSTQKGMALSMEFNYPSRFENDSVLKLIQSGFIIAFAGEDYKDMTPQEAFSAFEKVTEEECVKLGIYAKDDGPDFGTYFKNIKTTVSDTTGITITAKTETEDYTGGAHGSRTLSYYNIDYRNGKIIDENILFKKDYKEKLASLIEENLKAAKNQMGEKITIISPENVIPNGNFYFNDKGIVYVYNQYEIAPYSDGTIEVTITYDQIKDLINSEFEVIFEAKTE